MQHVLAVIVAVAVLGVAVGFTSRRVASLPRTPALVRRGATATATSIRHPVRAARSSAPRAAESVEAIWARARADDWRERRQARRSAAALRPPRERGATLRRLVIPKGAAQVPDPPAVLPVPVAVNDTPQSPQRHLSAVPSPQSSTVSGRTPTVTTGNGASSGGNGSSGYGAGADMLTSVQHLIAHVTAGGIQAKQRGYSVMGESLEYMSDQFTALANRMSEPGQNYPASAWEPWLIVAAHLKAAASASGEGASVIGSIRAMTVGDLAESSLRAPHHDELNKA